MAPLYPLRFVPVLRRYIWGGRRLATLLRKDIGSGQSCAESWEICDHRDDQSVVAHGPLAHAKTTLHQLVAERNRELLGRHAGRERFPLLLKFLDAADRLSVQVHPNDAQAMRMGLADPGKSEAWVVIAAEPQSRIYAGVKAGVDRATLAWAITRRRCQHYLHVITPRVGDCIYLPSGTVHALGGGVLVVEIQQSSDTTFRLFDWNRVDSQGRSRPLHVGPGLAVARYDLGPVFPQQPVPAGPPGIVRLVRGGRFCLDRWHLAQPDPARPLHCGGDDRCHLVTVLQGAIRLQGDPAESPLGTGGTALLPAGIGPVMVNPLEETILLDAYLP